MPRSLTRRTTALAAFAAAATVLSSPANTQTAAFDIASVRALAPGEPRGSDAVRVVPGGRLIAPAVTVRQLILAAYGIQEIQLIDGKRLLTDDRFAVEARTRAGVMADEARAMLRALLAERFMLLAHGETRELPVYVMTMVREDRRHGDQLRPSGPECAPVQGPPGIQAPPPPPPPPGPPVPADAITLGPEPMRCLSLAAHTTAGIHWSIRGMTMGRFSEQLTRTLARPVLDRTSLDGSFDIDVTYTDTGSAAGDSFANAPSLFTALQEQLGLKLESSRAPVEVLVIDAVQAPTEN